MSYLGLVKKFPLRSIRTAGEHSAAVDVLLSLTQTEQLTKDELDYVSALADLIGHYEKAALEQTSPMSPQEALRYLLDVNDLRAKDLAQMIEPSHTSAFLSRSRKLSKTEAARLGAFFKVDPMLFLDKVVPITSAMGVRKRKPDPRPTAPKPKSVFGGRLVAGAYVATSGSTARKSSARKATAARQSAKKKGAGRKSTKGARRPARG